MKPISIISQDLFDKVRSRFSNLEMGDETGAVIIDPEQARFFDFDFVFEGSNLGRVSISINDPGSLKVYFSQGITENQDDSAKKQWFNFLREMRFFAMRRLLRFDTRDIAKTNLDKNDFQHLAKTQAPKEEEMSKMNESKNKSRVLEGVMSDIDIELRDIVSREDHDALYDLFTANTPAGKYIQNMYDDIVIDNRLHPDDDFEQIEELVWDRLENDFGGDYTDYSMRRGEMGMEEDMETDSDSLAFWNQAAQKAGSSANIDWYAIGVEHGKKGVVMNPPYGIGAKALNLYDKGMDAGKQGVAEGKITLSTDPNWYGAEVGDYKASSPVVNIPSNRLVGFEPDDKMNQPKSKANVEKIVAGLNQGAKLPPLLVRKYKNGYQVLDGHHRFWAYKMLDVKSIPAQIVPDSDIEEKGQQGVAEGYTTEKQILTRIRQIMYDRKLSGTESNTGELNRLKQQLKDIRSQQGVAEAIGDIGSKRDQGKTIRKWRKSRGLDEQGGTEDPNSYNVVQYYEKTQEVKKLTNWLEKNAGLPKNSPLYFDDVDLVYGNKTIVPGALVDPTLTFNDLLTAVVQASKQGMGEGLQEGRWNNKSSKKTSRAVAGKTEVIVRHARPVDEEYSGSRSQRKNIKAIYIQNADGERFKYPFIHTAGAFAMAQHVDHGGVPHDPAGQAIVSMSEEIAKLSEFQRKIHRATLHQDASGITERAIGRMNELKAQVAALGKRQHYQNWRESFDSDSMMYPSMEELDAVTMEEYKQKFTQTNFQEELSAYFPLLHKIMSEQNNIDLEEYVSESEDELGEIFDIGMGQASHGKGHPDEEFAEWAEAVEQNKLTNDEITVLKQAISELPQGKNGPELKLGPEGSTAIEFFQGLGLDSSELEEKLEDMANVDADADALEVFKIWANDNYPELAVTLGISDTNKDAEELPAVDVVDQTEPTTENDEMSMHKGTMPTREAVIKEVAKLVKSRFNEDNPDVGPFNGKDNIALDVKKKCVEMFGDDIGEQAEQLAMQFMEKLSKRWEEKHGKIEDDGLARLKELLGNVKAKVEGIGDITNNGHAPGNNIMPAEEGVAQESGPDKSQVPAYKRKEQGGDWKMSTKDLEKEKTNSPTSSAGLARKKAELGLGQNESAELEATMKISNEGVGNFAKAIGTLGGWYQDDSTDPNIEVFSYDDREGGYYADGNIQHNLKTGEIKINYQDSYGGDEINDTFYSVGDAMDALRGGYPASHGGKAPNFDKLGDRDVAGPNDLYKTDRAGKKGTLTKSRMDTMKASSPYRMDTGPKGPLPEMVDILRLANFKK